MQVLVLHFRFRHELWKNCYKQKEKGQQLARSKSNSIESKISEALINLSISDLATKIAALTAAENKIRNISSLVKKQVTRQKLLKLKGNLLIIIMI